MFTKHAARYVLLILMLSLEATAGDEMACATLPAGTAPASGTAPAGGTASAATFLASGTLDHYGRLAPLSAEPQAEQRGLDRRQFSLSATRARKSARSPPTSPRRSGGRSRR